MSSFSTLNISFIIRKNRANANGDSPIYARISIGDERVEISTGRNIKPENWDSKSNKAITKKKGSVELNKFLDVIKTNIYNHHTEMVKNGEIISAKKLKAQFLGINENQKSLLQVFEFHNRQMKELEGLTYAAATVKRYSTTLGHIKSFLKYQYKIKDISSITSQLLLYR